MVLPQFESHNSKSSRRSVGCFQSTWSGVNISLCLSLVLNIFFLFRHLMTASNSGATNSPILVQTPDGAIQGLPMVWHGGHPAEPRAGSCWCGDADKYCMCTPSIAIDLIIVSGEQREYLWLVQRKDTSQLATMGGFVDVGETVEHAVQRELKEEMGIELQSQPTLFGVYSDPRRDNRRRNMSVVFAVYLNLDASSSLPHAGDDAKAVKRIHVEDIEQHDYFADHRTILLDYRRFVQGQPPEQSTEGDFASDIVRSTCAMESR